MDTTPITVLFVNHREYACGVYQMYKRSVAPVVASNDNYYYIETNEEWEHDHWINQLQPNIVVYNFYVSGATMPWLSNEKIMQQKGRFKQMSLFHEGNIDSKGFDLILHQDPTNTNPLYFTLPRQIPDYSKPLLQNEIPTIGSFGFGLGGKGFTRVVETVVQQYDAAHIRLHIPFAHFGDADGTGARSWSQACQAIAATKPTIQLTITHDLLPEDALLDFLAGNDINCFFYDDNIGRGISGTLDYALAVNRPIAITKSDQFRHMWNPLHMIEENTIPEIISRGIIHLKEYKDKWNIKTLIAAYEQAFRGTLCQ